MDLLSLLLSWNFLVLALAIAAATFVIRNILEARWQLDEKKIWNDTLLPCMPVLIGVLICLVASSFPFPVGITVLSAKLCFGAVAGLFSSQMFKVIKSLIDKKTL